MPRALLSLLLAALLAACQSGPAADCDDCAVAEAQAAAPFGQAAAASASGGQKASNQPTMSDPGSPGVSTTINRGSGPNSSTQSNKDHRSQAGAPSVNQGLVLPTEASAATGGSGVSPAVLELQEFVKDLRAQLAMSMAQGDAEARTALLAEIRGALAMLAEASQSNPPTTTNNYNFNGARIIQSVANGSKSGDAPGGAVDPEAAAAIGAPLAKAAEAAMTGEASPSEGSSEATGSPDGGE